MHGYDPAAWVGFFTAVTGAAAALTGLLFVAVSINLDHILGDTTKDATAVVTVVASLVVSPSMWSRLMETATNSRPVSAAAAPVTAVKKPAQAAGSYPCIGAAPVDEVLLVVRLYLDAEGLDDAGDGLVLADDHDELDGPGLPERGFQFAEQLVGHGHFGHRPREGEDQALRLVEGGRRGPGRQRARLGRGDARVHGHRAVVAPLVGRAGQLRQSEHRELAQPRRAVLAGPQRLRQRAVRGHQAGNVGQRAEDVGRRTALELERVEEPGCPRRLVVVLDQRNSCHAPKSGLITVRGELIPGERQPLSRLVVGPCVDHDPGLQAVGDP